MIRRASLLLALLLVTTSSLLAQGVPQDFDATMARTLRTFEVPGIAVAVVKDGKVVLANGYGLKKVGEASPVTADTIFAIASNTKAFTTAALAMLVEEGKLQWDDRVVDHLPGFQMYDPYVTREMTIRDLLVHRSGLGLGAGDLLYWPASNLSSREIVSKLRHIRPSTSFRSAYAYDNILYIVAGEVIAAKSGMPWAEFIRRRIFTPLGMSRSFTSPAEFTSNDADVAYPHVKFDGKVRIVDFHAADNQGSAGAIHSSVNDLAKWMIVQLDRGAIAGSDKRLFSEAQSREMWTAQTLLRISDPPKAIAALKPNFSAYALGWNVRDYRGRVVMTHTGGYPGYVSRVLLVPELKLGVAVLTNQQARGGYEVPAWTMVDAFVGAPPSDWVKAFAQAQEETESKAKETLEKQVTSRDAKSRPSLPLEKYAGTYRDAWYGDVFVAKEGSGLAIRFSHSPALTGKLEHWQHDTFIARWVDRSIEADAFVTFDLNPDGSIDEIRMKAVSPLTDFSYDFHDLELKPVR